MNPTKAVIFDLDGTLLDTAPDLLYALNQLRREHGLTDLPLITMRHLMSHGSKALIKNALHLDESDPRLPDLREQFFALYQQHVADKTQIFPQMENVLSHLEQINIPWGIVTNKLERHAHALLKALTLDQRTGCLICGDSLPKPKPSPDPILKACELLKQAPKDCIYVGDSAIDVIASKAAGATALVALYGYIGAEENPANWLADGYIQSPIEIIQWLR